MAAARTIVWKSARGENAGCVAAPAGEAREHRTDVHRHRCHHAEAGRERTENDQQNADDLQAGSAVLERQFPGVDRSRV